MSTGNNFTRRGSKSRNYSTSQPATLNRPRRFSLLYSSSDDEDDETDNTVAGDSLSALKQRRRSKTVVKPSTGANSKSEMKMLALRNKLKLLQSNTNSNASTQGSKNSNVLFKDTHNEHLINSTSSNSSLQSTVKKRKQPQNTNLISSSSSEDDDKYDDETSSDDEKETKPFSLNTNTQKNVDLKTISDLSDPSTSPEFSKSPSFSEHESKSVSATSDELNEKELLKAISSESDVEKLEEGLILEDDFSMDLDLDLDLEEDKQHGKGNHLEIFSNVNVDTTPKNHSEIYVAGDEDGDEDDVDELHINLGKDSKSMEDYDDEEEDEEDYDEMLLEAALITDSENNEGRLIHTHLSNNEGDEDAHDNVFINVDDLDPQSFYFDNEEEDDDDDEDDSNNSRNAFFQDEESTDEEEELPEISNKIKTRKRSVHNLHDSAFGKNLPKLNCWKADGRRPFSIIDGLSTKSLYAIAIEDDDEDGSYSSSSSSDSNLKDNLLTPAVKSGRTTVLNSNVFSARANINDQLLEEATSNDTTPNMRNTAESKSSASEKIIHDFPMDQLIAISSSSDNDTSEDDIEEENNAESDESKTDLPASATNSTEEIKMVIHKDKKYKDDGNEDLFTENSLNALMNNELIIEFPSNSTFNPLQQFRKNSLTNLQNTFANSKQNSKLGSADFALIQQLTQQQQDPLSNTITNRRGSVILEEAKESNLRYTKSGLFSEAAMMNLEEFITNSANGGEVQFEVDGLSFN
ncbi:hypothetical protein QEN19_001986 [Hanseniaspora menglaensis]